MKPKNLSPVALGLAWMASLGVVFVLGILSAFTFHLGPGAGADEQGDLTLAERDLALTLERYTGQPADLARIKAVGAHEAVPPQLEQALRAILREPDREERHMAATRLVRGLPARRTVAAIRFLQEIPGGPARDQLWGRFLEAWAEQDGRSAIALATAIPDLRERQLATQEVLRGWSKRQPSEAWNWAVEHGGTTRRAERWLEIILSNLGAANRETAFALIGRLPDRGFQARMALVVMDQILQVEAPREALKWLGEAPAAGKPEVAAYVAEAWAMLEPEAAARWLRESFPREIEGLARVVGEWAYANPAEAADWVWESFSGAARRELLNTVAAEWLAQSGPAPLAEWLNARGPDSSLDGAIEALALATAQMDPATALIWAQSVVDPDARGMLEILIGRAWLRAEPASAGQSLPVLLASESARAVLLGPEVFEELPPALEAAFDEESLLLEDDLDDEEEDEPAQ